MTRPGLLITLAAAALLFVAAGLATGSEGLSWTALHADLLGDQAGLIIGQVRAPRTLGALGVGALLGLSGAVAQGLFRNPLADPYLLGSAAGSSLAVVAMLSLSALAGHVIDAAGVAALERIGLVGAAFAGSVAGVALTLLLARGAQHTARLLLSGVIVGVLLGAASDLITLLSPAALRARQMFLLGSTGFIGWTGVAILAAGLLVALPLALRLARALDALTLGEDSAASLGLDIAKLRLVLVLLFAGATGLAVSQAGLVAFVGLMAPHLVRRLAPGPNAHLLLASAAAGGVMVLASDVLARAVIAPEELPLGVITALVGGGYLLWLLHRGGTR